MILSIIVLKSASALSTKNQVRENFNKADCCDDPAAVSTATKVFCVAIATIFFLIELVLLVFAIKIALHQTSGNERIVNVILAVTVTTPYVLLKLVMNPSVTKAALAASF